MPSGAPYWDEEEEEPSILDTEEAFVNAREGIPGAQDVISNLAGAYEEDPTAEGIRHLEAQDHGRAPGGSSGHERAKDLLME